MKRLLLNITSWLLLVCCCFGLFACVRDLGPAEEVLRFNTERNSETLKTVRDLYASALSLERSAEDYDSAKLEYVEGVVTDSEGTVQLEEGETALSQGEEQLAAGQSQYDNGAAALAAAEAQYAQAQAQLEAGRQAYADGEARLEAGKQTLADSEAQLEAAKAEYAEGEAKLQQAEPIYNAVMPLYQRYLDRKAEYEAAVAEGDMIKAALLWGEVTAAEALYSAQLGGYSIEGIVADYQAGKAQLDAAAVQIAQGEEQLAAAKEEIAQGQAQLDESKLQLDEGQAQLDAAAAELEAARNRLSAAKGELNQGYEELDQGKATLQAGREQLEENRESLAQSMAALSEYESEDEKVAAGILALKADSGIAAVLSGNETDAQICKAAIDYLEGDAKTMQADIGRRRLLDYIGASVGVLGIAAAVTGLCAARYARRKLVVACGWLGGAALCCALALVIWGLSGGIFFAAYRLENGGGSGALRTAALCVQAAAAALFGIMSAVAVKAVMGASAVPPPDAGSGAAETPGETACPK